MFLLGLWRRRWKNCAAEEKKRKVSKDYKEMGKKEKFVGGPSPYVRRSRGAGGVGGMGPSLRHRRGPRSGATPPAYTRAYGYTPSARRSVS